MIPLSAPVIKGNKWTYVKECLDTEWISSVGKYVDRFEQDMATYLGATYAIAILLDEPPYAKSNKWFYAILCNEKQEKERLLNHLNSNGIQARPLWFLNHLQKPYVKCQSYKIEKALKMYDTIVNILCSVNLTENEIKKVVNVMKETC